MSKILVIAPHPDDETLGCGGTLLRHKENNDELFWLIVTGIDKDHGWNQTQIKKREEEIKQVKIAYKFKKIYNLALPTTGLDIIPISDMINSIGKIINEIKPKTLYIPFIADVHTDHQIIVKAVNACIKWYRYPSVIKVLSYETLSETDFNYSSNQKFQPNYYIDISRSNYTFKRDVIGLRLGIGNRERINFGINLLKAKDDISSVDTQMPGSIITLPEKN